MEHHYEGRFHDVYAELRFLRPGAKLAFHTNGRMIDVEHPREDVILCYHSCEGCKTLNLLVLQSNDDGKNAELQDHVDTYTNLLQEESQEFLNMIKESFSKLMNNEEVNNNGFDFTLNKEGTQLFIVRR